MVLKVPFGILNGTLLEPQSVANGKACGCTCPGCGCPLIAYNGPSLQRTSYFGHMPGEECRYAVESALHLAGKEALVRQRRMHRPVLYVDANGIVSKPKRPLICRLVESEATAQYQEVLSEQRFSSRSGEMHSSAFRADIQARQTNCTDWVEICVTHPVDAGKQAALQREGLRVLEVDLRRFLKGPVSLADVEHAVIADVSNKTWLAHPGVPKAMAALRADFELEQPQPAEFSPPEQLELLPADWRINQPVRNEDPYLGRASSPVDPLEEREAILRWRLGLRKSDGWPQYLDFRFDDERTVCVPGRHWTADVYLEFVKGRRLSRLDVGACMRYVRERFSVTSAAALASIEASMRGEVLRQWERFGYVRLNIDGSVWITGKE